MMVRGARSVRLRRGLDLPAIGLSEFAGAWARAWEGVRSSPSALLPFRRVPRTPACVSLARHFSAARRGLANTCLPPPPRPCRHSAGIVTADAAQQQPLGVLHLLAGVQAAAEAHWNASHPDQSLGLVALDLDLAPSGAALLAAPAAGGGVQRLRARRVRQGAIELLPRDGPPAGPQAAPANAVALRQEAGAELEGPWPLKSVHPAQLQVRQRALQGLGQDGGV